MEVDSRNRGQHTIRRKQTIQRHGKNINNRRAILPPPMKRPHLPRHRLRVLQRRHALRRQQLRQQHHVAEPDRHPAARQRMPHVHRVAQQDQPRRALRRRRQERVRHAAELALRYGGCEAGTYAGGEGWEDYVLEVVLHAPC